MTKAAMNIEKELTGRGYYCNVGDAYGYPYPLVEKLSQPISPKENLIRYYRGEAYEWIPDVASDQIDVTAMCNPDVVASGFEGGLDAFGVRWVPDPQGIFAALTDPREHLWEDISDWRNMPFPNPDSWDWAGAAEKFLADYGDDDRVKRGIVLCGYFERLIANMNFTEAAMCLVTDPEEVKDFFEELTKFNIKVADHCIDDYQCDIIMFHDDWSAQFSPFFSVDTVMELIVPYLKQVVDHVHARGKVFVMHSCGNGLALVPALKAAGVDGWQCQPNAVDIKELMKACGDDIILEPWSIEIPAELSDAELEGFIRDTFLTYCGEQRGTPNFADLNPDRVPMTRRLLYKIGRELAAQKAVK